MPTLEIDARLRRDGWFQNWIETIRRLQVDEIQEFGPYEKVDDGDGTTFTAIPTGQLDEIQVLVLQAVDQQLTFRLDGQTDAGIVVNAGGTIILIDVDIDAAAATNVTVNNNSGSTALIRGVAGGT